MKASRPFPNAALVFAVLPSIIAGIFVAPVARGDPNDYGDPNEYEFNEKVWLAASPVRHEALEYGNDGPFRVPLVMLLTSERQWRDTMDSLALLDQLSVLPAPEPPPVDWRRDAVVVVSMGEFTELHCYAEIRELRHIGRRTLCDVHVDVLPSPRIQVFTNPYYVVKIGRRAGGLAAARYEYRFLDSPAEPPRISYSNCDAFLKTADDAEPTGAVSWGALKGLFK